MTWKTKVSQQLVQADFATEFSKDWLLPRNCCTITTRSYPPKRRVDWKQPVNLSFVEPTLSKKSGKRGWRGCPLRRRYHKLPKILEGFDQQAGHSSHDNGACWLTPLEPLFASLKMLPRWLNPEYWPATAVICRISNKRERPSSKVYGQYRSCGKCNGQYCTSHPVIKMRRRKLSLPCFLPDFVSWWITNLQAQ